MPCISPQRNALVVLVRTACERGLLYTTPTTLYVRDHGMLAMLGTRADVGEFPVAVIGPNSVDRVGRPSQLHAWVHLRQASAEERKREGWSEGTGRVDAVELLRIEDGALVLTGIVEVYVNI